METPSVLPLPSALRVLDLKAFVPAKDLSLALQFYADLGFTILWQDGEIAGLQIGDFRFLLQKFYVEQHAGNFMMHLMVESTDAWWAHIEQAGIAAKYPGIMCKPPALQPWGLRVLYLSDPTGVLWHIAERPKQ